MHFNEKRCRGCISVYTRSFVLEALGSESLIVVDDIISTLFPKAQKTHGRVSLIPSPSVLRVIECSRCRLWTRCGVGIHKLGT